MARNVEARIETVDAIAATVAAMADRGPFEIQQDDTFFGRIDKECGACPRSTRPS